MKYLIKFSYDGSKFNGFQRLKLENSVQEEIERALSVINKSPVVIKGAGRTDRGVHAMNQAASFTMNVDVPCERLINAINSLVNNYIHVNSCVIVSDDFHARFSSKKKRYIYRLWCGDYSPVKYDYYLFVSKNLNWVLIEEGLKLFKGEHNFKNFVAGMRNNYNAVILKAEMIRDGDNVEFIFEGKGFYRYMVRNLVGSLIDLGRGKIDLEYLNRALVGDEKMAITTALAQGLYLDDVIYEEI